MSDEKVNLNQATVGELAVLPGIGQKLAAKIVAYRQEQGAFAAAEELSSVPGISDRMVGNLLDRLTVGVTSPEDEPPSIEGEAGLPEMEDIVSDEGGPEDDSAGDGEVAQEEEEIVEAGPGTVIAVSPEGDAVVTEATVPEQDLAAELEEERQAPAAEPPLLLEEGDDVAAQEPSGEEEVAATGEEAGAEDIPIDTSPAETGSEPAVEAVIEDELEPGSITLLEERASEQVAAPRPSAPATKESQSTLLAGYILSALAGAFLGAVLVLFFLLVVNGTLRFANNSRANDFQQQMDDDISTLNQGQADLQGTADSLTGDLRTLEDQLATVAADQASLNTNQERLQADLSSLGDDMNSATDSLADMAATVTALEEETAAMNERLARAAESAEAFDAFLNGMRDLLLSLQGAEPEATGTPEPTGSASPDVTTVPGASATPAPTRTPRPTATPLTLPTPTPRS